MKINDNCVACGACKEACPSVAIRLGAIYVIDPAACVECGACEAACPNAAIEG
jgi:ferredoxin